jgi:uncharacterized membrane protein
MFELIILVVIIAVALAWQGRFKTMNARIARLEAGIKLLQEGGRPTAATEAASSAPPVVEQAPSAIAAPPEAVTPAESLPADAAMPAPEPAAAVPSAAQARAARGHRLEERFGTRWVVWVGGLALALGAVFMVQYSIEQGWLGPPARIFLGGLLAAVLIGAGEWTRRRDVPLGMAGVPSAYIPGILTAAGTVAAFATAYAAYALYGFLSPASAFVVLGLIGLATLGGGLLHGPWLAGLGALGAYVTPVLITSPVPNYWALYIYLAVVTAAAFAMASVRKWRWLAIGAVAFGVLWTLAGLDGPRDALQPQVFHVVAGFALAAALIVSGLLFGPRAAPDRIEPISSGALAAYLAAATVLVLFSQHDALPLFAFAALSAGTVVIAWRTPSAVGAVPAAGLLLVLIMVDWAQVFAPGDFAPLEFSVDLVAAVLTGTDQIHIAIAVVLCALFAAAGYLAQGRYERPEPPILWAATAAATPVLVLVTLYFRIAGLERSILLGAVALALAAVAAGAAEYLSRRAPRPGIAAAGAIFATGAVASLALALTFALEKGWLTVGLALMVPGIAWIATQRPWPMLRWLAAAMTVVVVLRVGYEPRIAPGEIGTFPIVNWLLYGYGVPALSFWVAGWLLRRRADDIPARIADSAAILFTALLLFWQIRHVAHGGDIYAVRTNLGEVALQVCVALAMAIGLEGVRERTQNIIHHLGALIIAGLALLGIVFGLVLFENPLWNPVHVGGPLFNLILLGYGLPAAMTAILGLFTRETRPPWYRAIAAVTAVALAMLYLTLEVRRFFHGPVLSDGTFTSAEQYTYSAVWLVFGVLLLLAGIAIGSRPLRFASAAVVIATIGKVFLIDLAGVTGVFRALSFICLGVVLVGIGWLYQRLLFPRPAAGTTRQPPSPEPPPSTIAPQ